MKIHPGVTFSIADVGNGKFQLFGRLPNADTKPVDGLDHTPIAPALVSLGPVLTVDQMLDAAKGFRELAEQIERTVKP